MGVKEVQIVTQAVLKKDRIPLKAFGGHLPKMFATLYDRPSNRRGSRKNKSSLFFGELFRSLMSGKSTYFTYLNDSIVGKKKEEVEFPEYVRCVIKKMSGISTPYYNEVVGSRLGNLFGVDVVYNTAFKKDPDDELSQGEYDYLISVDYRLDGYEDKTLESIGVEFNEETPIQTIIKSVDAALSKLNKENKIQLTTERYTAFIEGLVRQYLFRSLICEDYDFEAKNVCILIGKDGDFKLGPCFDMECFFKSKRSHVYYKEVAERDLGFLFQSMPEVLEKFLSRCSKCLRDGQIDKAMEMPVEADKEYYKSMVKNNITRLCQIHEKLKNPPVMGEN